MDYNPGSLDITLWEALEPGIIPTIIAIIFVIIALWVAWHFANKKPLT